MSVTMLAATSPGSGSVPNEDWYGCLPDAVAVLDGVTVRPGMASGCVHGTPWYVSQLGRRLIGDTASPTLAGALALAISGVAALHQGTCDLGTLGAPSAALAVLRVSGTSLEWLVLADVTIVLDTAAGIRVLSDTRVDASVAGLDSSSPCLSEKIAAARAAHRNRPGGYWVAAESPAAAAEALAGSVPLEGVRRVMVLTDGAARLADLFGRSWADVLDLGPSAVIGGVRGLEAEDPECSRWPRMKTADDATAVLWEPFPGVEPVSSAAHGVPADGTRL